MKRKFPAVLIILVLLLLADITASAFLLYSHDKSLAYYTVIPAVFLVVAFIIALLVYSKHSVRHFSKMNSHLENSAAEYMNSLPAPVAVVTENGTFVWYNRLFSETLAKGQDLYGLDIEAFINVDLKNLRNNGFSICSANGSIYKISVEPFEKNDISFLVLYFHDESEFYKLKKYMDEIHPTVLIITIDNYDEIMQNAKESQKAKTSVQTEQLLENFMNRTNGIIKKTSANTFYAIIEDKHLNEIIAEKFKILDEVRNIKIDEKNMLTLSIGVGYGSSSLAESEAFARQCLDMALGRGGDQAVVKTDTGYRFFGGVSKGVEKKSRAKTRIIANALQEMIENSENVYIMGHRFGDLDSVGASCGLAGAINLLGKNTFIAVDTKKNLAVNLIEKISKSVENNLFIHPNDAADNITENDLLIIVDTHNKDFIENAALYRNAKNVIVIDHHRKNVNFIDNAVIFHHEPYASSASEMVTELIQYFRFKTDQPLNSIYAEALLAGITLDTKNFVMRTGVRTFEAAAFLRKLGADTVTVKLLFSNSIESYKRKTQIISSAKIHNNCAIAVADFKSDDIRIVAPQAADELLGVSDVNASFVIFKTGDSVNISARSLGVMNVQVIMEQLGGGGHQTMAATQIENVSLSDAFKLLVKAIDECTLY